jgi:hypothetical protein
VSGTVRDRDYPGSRPRGGGSLHPATEGFRSKENKNFPTSTNKNKPRSDLRDAKQRPGKSDLCTLEEIAQQKRSNERGRRSLTSVSSSRSDLIQAPQRAAPPSVAHVHHDNESASSVQQGMVE